MSSVSTVTDARVYYCYSSVQAICGFKNPHIQQRRIWQDITLVGKNGQQGPVHQSSSCLLLLLLWSFCCCCCCWHTKLCISLNLSAFL